MSSFRRRTNPVVCSLQHEHRYDVKVVDENTSIVSPVYISVDNRLNPPSPTLDDMLRAGVSVKDVKTDGILDSYDENDYPIADMEAKILDGIEKVKTNKKTKKGDKE